MAEDKKNNFWPSYVDIMTTLFAVMLILFAVSYSRFKNIEKGLNDLVEEYEDIITVYSTVGKIDSTDYFDYNSTYLKHLFTVNVEYQRKQFDMNFLQADLIDVELADRKRDSVMAAGLLIEKTICGMNTSTANSDNIKFLIVVEGQSSKIPFNDSPWLNNYTLSYLRAQYLLNFWQEGWRGDSVDLYSLDKCEVIIAGSGEMGVPRITPSEDLAEFTPEWSEIESRNQRFLIHIVPVVGNINAAQEKIEKVKNMRKKNLFFVPNRKKK